MNHTLNKSPAEDKALETGQFPWEIKWVKNPTMSRGAYKPYSTVKQKYVRIERVSNEAGSIHGSLQSKRVIRHSLFQ